MATTGGVLERTHRFALSISGGIALGTYEAGVLSQMYRDIYDLNASLRGRVKVAIDAISGASAGSVTGLILAQAISLGRTPDDLEQRMRDCWVELLDIENLLNESSAEDAAGSIFTNAVVDTVVTQALDIPPKPTQGAEPIALWITMTNLDGIPLVIDFARPGHAQASTELFALDYRDYIPFLISGSEIRMVEDRMVVPNTEAVPAAPSDGVWQAAVQAAMASSAFPVAFPSRFQQRNLMQYPEYKKFKEEVESNRLAQASGEPALQAERPLPETAWFQFVDGGLFNNEPIGKCIDAVAFLNEQFPERDPDNPANQGRTGRSFVIIEPDPQLPADVERALAVSTEHADSPMLPSSVLAKILSAYFNSALYGDFQTAEQTNVQIRALNAALEKLDGLGLEASKVTELKAAIRQAVGLQDKDEITLQRIPHELPSAKRLAGAFAGHFGGFLRKDYREADFVTGRYEARQWFVHWLVLWLQSHAEDLGMTKDEITLEYVLSLFKAVPPDPVTTPIPPTNLTPVQLANAGWFPNRDSNGNVSDVAQQAALTEDERRQIIKLAEARGETLLDAWLHVPPLAHLPVHLAMGALEHLFNGRFIRDPH